MPIEIRLTSDGSHTLYNSDLDESYHSVHGAVQESMHVFIKSGLDYMLEVKRDIWVLEVGMGTGLNAWLTINQVLHSDAKVHYVAVEPHPVDISLVDQLNYPQMLHTTEYRNRLFQQLHRTEWEKFISLTPEFELRKMPYTLEDFKPMWIFDLIYFDAFAPSKHPQIWEKPMLKKLYDITTPGGILLTYSAKGQFKRDLKETGWLVETLQGPPGKREMTRATKPVSGE
ncbi:tRNA (5-methylaminomethyl-2-thiouridine)(34)-methyltransferase MnmD [Rhodocytophaga rosea]|uniref:tRNA (5-methylaminomethyl-2-thiouridine)(34)-methyltransferase MnmD n=1 Tax=Rhodocytophaga rosea TaxID=2704465 RepID=A0A6C0GQQ6_9BACT|nr:tRNA (5-methylaminomethyl-2-thiouridine)(34)-methyltransferase MnmD [Rhodocytophaga rosea]QHT70406.1 tRNA (5-methylaminomethyl-2-thiouridine)(34)-methyltransferase MnmD [Rhodocytophaga rosea]